MYETTSDSDHERYRERLKQLRKFFEEKERWVLSGEIWSKNADQDESLFEEYMSLHLRYGEKRPPRESGLVVFYRKLLRLREIKAE